MTHADLFEILSSTKHAEMAYFAIQGIYTTSAIKVTLSDIIALPNSCPRLEGLREKALGLRRVLLSRPLFWFDYFLRFQISRFWFAT